MGRRCIPDIVLKNEGPMVQTCRNIHVYVVNTASYMLGPTSLFMDCSRKQTHQCAQYKLKIVYKTRILNNFFPCCSTRENLSIHVPTN